MSDHKSAFVRAMEDQLERDMADMRRTADIMLQHRFPKEHAEMVRDLEPFVDDDGVICLPGLPGIDA